MERKRMLGALIITLALVGGTGSAIWLSGLVATGTVVSTSSAPEYMTFDLGEFNITSQNATTYFTYNNPNSEADVEMVLGIDIVSTDPSCHYTEGTDFYVGIDGTVFSGNYETVANGGSVNRTMQPGDTEVYVRLDPHPEICPLEGNITITVNLL